MADKVPFSQPVEDSVPKVDNAVAVGEDLEFQERWWKFEHRIWIFFLIVLVCDAIGLFGRGFLSKAERKTPDGAINLRYERIERASTPSIMTFRFGPSAIQNGAIHLYVSQSIVKDLGAQRISPQPASSVLADGGITYTFPVTTPESMVEIALEPSFPGIHDFRAGIAGTDPIRAHVAVVP